MEHMIKPLNICVLAAANNDHTFVQCGIMRDFGHNVTLVSPNNGPCPDGVTHIPCGVDSSRGIIAKLRWLKVIYNGLKPVEADVYHAQYAAELTTWMAWALRKKPLVVSCLGGDVLFDEQGTLGPVGRWLTKRVLLSCDQVTVVSNFVGDVVQSFGVPCEKIQRVIWGVNHEVFHTLETGESARGLWNVAEDAQVIFSPRQLRPLYNQLMMIDAMGEIVKHRPNAILVLSAFNQDDDYRVKIDAKIDSLGLADHVRFLPSMNPQEMVLAYNSANIVISLPPTDGTPVSVMESMACGTPVIMADLERFKDLFTHKETVWFTKLQSVDVAEGALALLDNPALHSRLKKGGLDLIKTEADLHSQSRLLEDIFFRLRDKEQLAAR